MNRTLEFIIVLACIVAASFVSYNIGYSRAPEVNCSVQVERELISNAAFRSYVTRVYGHVFQKELEQYMMSPAMEAVVLEWLRKEAPFCRDPKVSSELKHNPLPTASQYGDVFMQRKERK